MRPRLAFVTAVVLSVVGAVCAVAAGTPGRDQRVSARPIVLAAASLTEVLPRIEPEARYSFGSSNSLAEQIRRGAPVDVYLSASPAHAQALHRGQLLRKPIAFATNSLVVIVPRSNPANLRSVFDLTKRPKLKLVVAGHKVPIGLYTREVLKRLGLLRVLRKTVSLEPDVKGIVGKVALGQADAGFVYLTDRASGRSRFRRALSRRSSTSSRSRRSRGSWRPRTRSSSRCSGRTGGASSARRALACREAHALRCGACARHDDLARVPRDPDRRDLRGARPR